MEIKKRKYTTKLLEMYGKQSIYICALLFYCNINIFSPLDSKPKPDKRNHDSDIEKISKKPKKVK